MDSFHALLALEASIPGGPGELPHFFAVGSYGLQHPEAMQYTKDVLTGLRAAVQDVLSGARTLADIRRRVRYEADRAGRVTRREGDEVPTWGIRDWPITVSQVVDAGMPGYAATVEGWARSIVERLEGVEPRCS